MVLREGFHTGEYKSLVLPKLQLECLSNSHKFYWQAKYILPIAKETEAPLWAGGRGSGRHDFDDINRVIGKYKSNRMKAQDYYQVEDFSFTRQLLLNPAEEKSSGSTKGRQV